MVGFHDFPRYFHGFSWFLVSIGGGGVGDGVGGSGVEDRVLDSQWTSSSSRERDAERAGCPNTPLAPLETVCIASVSNLKPLGSSLVLQIVLLRLALFSVRSAMFESM